MGWYIRSTHFKLHYFRQNIFDSYSQNMDSRSFNILMDMDKQASLLAACLSISFLKYGTHATIILLKETEQKIGIGRYLKD